VQAKVLEFGDYELIYAEAGPVYTNLYILINKKTKKAVSFDTPPDSKQFIDAVLEKYGATLTDIYLTHSHWDHFGDAMAVKRDYKCDIWINQLDEYRLLEPNKYIGFALPIEFEVTSPDHYLSESGNISILNLHIELLHVPGHTEGSICFVSHDNKFVIAGDTLFRGSIGRTDLHGGDMELLLSSIRQNLLKLPDDYTVLSGHGPETTIGYEKKYNQFVGVEPMTTISV